MESQQIELSTGARVFVASKGRGDELVVFLHAAGADHTMWYHQMEALDDERYTIASYDLRGHGRSAFDIENTLVREAVTIGAFAKDTLSLIEKLGFRRAHLVGLSMGGGVALEVFKRRSDVVQSLALANTAANFPDAESNIAWMQQRLSTMSMAENARALVPKMFGPGAPREIVERAIQIEGAKSHHIYIASYSSLLQSDYRRMLELIDVPLLLIGGSADTFTPTDPGLTSIHGCVPTAELVEIAGAGHYSNLDHPAEFTRALRPHLLRARSSQRQRLGVSVPKTITVDSLPAMLAKRGVQVWRESPQTADMARGHWRMSGKTQVILSDQKEGRDADAIDVLLAGAGSDPLVLPSSIQPLTIHETSRRRRREPAEPSADALERAARLIDAAHRPVVITADLGRHRGGPESLVQLAHRFAIPVIEHGRSFFNFPTRHPMHLGFNASAFVKQADLAIVIDSSPHWVPELTQLSHRPKVITLGLDPEPADLTLAGDPALAIRALASLLDKSRPDRDRIAGRFAAFASEHRRVVQAAQTRAIADASRAVITRQFLSYCIGEAIDDRVVIVNDRAADPQLIPRRVPDSWFEGPLAYAVGAQMAAPDLTFVATVNDSAGESAGAPPISIITFNRKGGQVTSPRELPAAIQRALATKTPLDVHIEGEA